MKIRDIIAEAVPNPQPEEIMSPLSLANTDPASIDLSGQTKTDGRGPEHGPVANWKGREKKAAIKRKMRKQESDGND